MGAGSINYPVVKKRLCGQPVVTSLELRCAGPGFASSYAFAKKFYCNQDQHSATHDSTPAGVLESSAANHMPDMLSMNSRVQCLG